MMMNLLTLAPSARLFISCPYSKIVNELIITNKIPKLNVPERIHPTRIATKRIPVMARFIKLLFNVFRVINY